MPKTYTYPIIFLIGCVVGSFFLWIAIPSAGPFKKSCVSKYPFISTEIDCSTINETASQIQGLQKEIAALIDAEKKEGHITEASVFYRDLNSRRWFGINENISIHPASLIKLPVAIMYYKIADFDPSILNQKLTIPTEDANDNQSYMPPADPLTPGQSYSVQDMITHMIIYSDNTPFTPLMNASEVFHDKILSDLGIYQPATGNQPEVWTVTTKSYANIFRSLYNTSYLNITYSNAMLELLSRSTYTKGLAAGVPDGVTVSHKFGEGEGITEDGTVKTKVLNDCGIIYKQDAPYILCIMTEGKEFSDLETTIKRITKASYETL